MNLLQSYLQGFRTGKSKMLELADLASDPTIPAGLRPEKYGRAVIKDPEFYAGLKQKGITAKETPAIHSLLPNRASPHLRIAVQP